MTDMTSVIEPRSDQLNSDSLLAGSITICIRDVAVRPGTEQPVSIFFDGDNGKPWKPCKSASRVLVSAWGPDANAYRGRLATLYRDPDVTWGGMKVGGIRVSHLSHIERPLVIALTEKKGSKKIATINPLAIEKREPDFTIEDAELALRTAKTEDDLRAEWANPRMKPHKTALKAVLDERKAALSPASESATAAATSYNNATSQTAYETAEKQAHTLGVYDDPVVVAARDAAKERGL